ncbi:MAG: VOC family protein [Pseudomonadota bacterium]|nr:VOC family protein [Pseudomonadota bacterium]
MYKWIDHIVVRVKDIEEGLQDYEGKMGLKRREDPKEIPELGMKRAILPLGDYGRFIEICEPLGEGAIGNALEKHSEGLHLVALGVDDIEAAKAEMQSNGARLIEAGKMVFVHPKDGHGVMYQLVERK